MRLTAPSASARMSGFAAHLAFRVRGCRSAHVNGAALGIPRRVGPDPGRPRHPPTDAVPSAHPVLRPPPNRSATYSPNVPLPTALSGAR